MCRYVGSVIFLQFWRHIIWRFSFGQITLVPTLNQKKIHLLSKNYYWNYTLSMLPHFWPSRMLTMGFKILWRDTKGLCNLRAAKLCSQILRMIVSAGSRTWLPGVEPGCRKNDREGRFFWTYNFDNPYLCSPLS